MNRALVNYLVYGASTLLILLAGIIFFMLYNQHIILHLRTTKTTLLTTTTATQQATFELYYPIHNKLHQEKRTGIYHTPTDLPKLITTLWLQVLEEEVIHKKI